MEKSPVILITEDDEPLRGAMARALRAEGHRVEEAGSGAECLRLAMALRPDLVLLDVVLPDADGTDICFTLKNTPELAGLHVLFIFGIRTSPGEQAEALRRGADGYLVKPVDMSELAARVEVALRRRKSEEQLRVQRDLLQKVIDTIPNPVFIKNRQGVYSECNQAFEEYLGLDRTRILGKTVYEIAPPELADVYYRADMELFEHPGVQTYEAQVAYADGVRRDVIFYKSTFEDLEGQLSGMVGVILDITPRKRAERELERERDRLARYFDVAGVMVVVLDAGGRVELINRRGCEILGYREEEIRGTDWLDGYLPARESELVRDIFNRLMKGEVEAVEYVEQPVLTRGGEERIISWHNTVLYDDEGKISGTLSSGEDVTERVRREKELEELNRDLRAFALTLSHDLKSPLSNAYGYAVSLAGSCRDLLDEQCREGLEIIEHSLLKMNLLIDGMLEYVQAGKGKTLRQKVDLGLLTGGVVEDLRETGVLEGARVSIQPALSVIHGDPARLAQVLRNLLGNAAKFRVRDREPVIEVGLVPGEDSTTLFVSDNGPGIRPDELETLFEPLTRGEGTGDIPGHGLGLAIVKRAVESWGGRIWAESEPGQGSTFFFTVPSVKSSS